MHRREGASEAAPEAVRQAVGGGCQSGWGRLHMPLRPALAVRGTVAEYRLDALEGVPHPLPMHSWLTTRWLRWGSMRVWLRLFKYAPPGQGSKALKSHVSALWGS